MPGFAMARRKAAPADIKVINEDDDDWSEKVDNDGCYDENKWMTRKSDLTHIPETPAETHITIPLREKKTLRFWLIFASLMMVVLLTAIDMTIVSTSLPTIVKDLPASDLSPAWVSSAFLLTTTAFQPLMGAMADIIGRRGALVLGILFFLLGSIVAGQARSMLLLVIGRAIQGVGGGGIQALVEIILSDMTTLRERGIFVAIISLDFAVGSFVAPVLGGLFSGSNWRWIFYINVPICIVSLVQIILCLKIETTTIMSLKEKLQRTDLIANTFLFGSTVGLLVGFTDGGITYPWTSWRILTSLIAGMIGLATFVVLEFVPNRFAPFPVLPRRIFNNRTATSCFALTFFHGCICYGLIFILPIYFQAIRGATPLNSSIDMFAATAPGPFSAIGSGLLMAYTGRYKTQMMAWWVMLIIGLSLVFLMNIHTPTWKWVLFQIIGGIPIGALFTLSLPAIQASLGGVDVAISTGAFSFFRSFGSVWGIALGTNVFSGVINKKLMVIKGLDSLGLRGNTAMGFATEIQKLPADLIMPTRIAYQDALRLSFLAFIPVAAVGLFVSFFVKDLPLSDDNGSSASEHILTCLGVDIQQTVTVVVEERRQHAHQSSLSRTMTWSSCEKRRSWI